MFRVDYHQWPLVVTYILILGVFLYGILRPRRRSEWRSAGVAQAFIIALYAEMYGLPLTMYLVAWLTGRTEFAQDHFHGHAWAFLLSWGDTGAIGFDIVGQLLIVCGATLALVGWRQVHRGRGTLVTGGLYRFVRHPHRRDFQCRVRPHADRIRRVQAAQTRKPPRPHDRPGTHLLHACPVR